MKKYNIKLINLKRTFTNRPIRCLVLPCQLDWNNVTKRHYNPNPTPYKFPKDCKTPLYELANLL